MVSVLSTTSEHEENEPLQTVDKDEPAPLVVVSEKKPKTRPPPSQPSPSPFKRLALVVLLSFLFWAGLKLRDSLVLSKQSKVIHASRYSKEFKFRPAASPIITETLKDGRTRLRGALVEPTLAPPPPSDMSSKKRKGINKNKKRKKRTKAGGNGSGKRK